MATATPERPLPPPLQGRVAVVTGSSRGIGRAIALHLASLGAKVVVNYTANSAQAEAVAAEINSSAPGSAIVVRADVSEPSHVKTLFDAAEEALGLAGPHPGELRCNCGPHFLHHSQHLRRGFRQNLQRECEGGVPVLQGGRESTEAWWRRADKTPVVHSGGDPEAQFRGVHGFKGSGADHGQDSGQGLKGTQITVNGVAPGPIATEMFLEGKSEEQIQWAIDMCPLGRLGETRDVAPVVGFLASDASEWVNGQIIGVNGGYA